MTSGGAGKTAIAFIIGAALALGGVVLYTHLTPRAPQAELATATFPAVPDGVQKLPDDDLPAAAPVKPAGPPPPEPAPPHVRRAKPRVEATHVPARRAIPPVRAKVSHRSEPPQLIAANNPAPQNQPLTPTPYTPPAPAPQVQPAPDPGIAPISQAQPAPPPRQPRTVTISVGTSLNVRINQTLSSDHNFAGDTFQGTLESQITLEDALIAERGSKVTGKVVNVQRGAHGDSGSDLSITLTQINTTDGQRIAVQTSVYDQQTTRNTGRDAAKVGGGAALGAIIGAIAGGGKGAAVGAGVGGAAGGGDVLLTHGRPAVLQSETAVAFRLTAPVTITEHINQ